MKGPVDQGLFNQVRDSRIIEWLQTIAKSPLGPQMAFKGGTALRLFWGLPRYSEDLDFIARPGSQKVSLLHGLKRLAEQQRYEITDAHAKFHTVLLEVRFRWEGPNFHVKVEVSCRGTSWQVELRALRGVPVILMKEEKLVTEKLFAFMDRQLPRDLFDLWFILEKRLPWDLHELSRQFGSLDGFWNQLKEEIAKVNRRKVLTDLGKLLDPTYRNWLKTSFYDDLHRLVEQRQRELVYPEGRTPNT